MTDKTYHTKASGAGLASEGTLYESLGKVPDDWEVRDGSFNIKIGHAWLPVSEDAVIREPVPTKPALYWQDRRGIIGFRPSE